MEKAVAFVQKFGLFAQKPVEPSEKDDMFSLRLKRLQRTQAQQAAHLFRNRPSHQEA